MKVMISLSTEAQQHTEAFKKWFGKSKVVDAHGNPKRVYHGTSADFKEFDPKSLGHGNDENGVGFYFTDNPEWTEMYAGGEGGNVIPVYLKIQKPIYWDRQPEITATQISKFMFYAGNRHVNQFLRDNFDVEYMGLSAARAEFIGNIVGSDLIEASFSLFNDLYAGEKTQSSFAEVFKKVTGYDGVIVNKHGRATNYVVFSPTQIKSAVGNAGTFKPRTADITK